MNNWMGVGVKRWMALGLVVWMWGLGCSSAPEVEGEQAAQTVEQSDSELLPVGDSPILGERGAPITVVEFSSLQCPFSARASGTVEQLVADNPGEVRLVFKHLPLPFQEESMPAARAAEAAYRQGDEAFWAMRSALYDRMDDYGSQPMVELGAEIAGELGLDVEAFREDFEDPQLEARIEGDQQLAIDSGVEGTPLFAINGVVINGAQPLEEFQAVVDEQKQVVESLRQEGVAEQDLYVAAMEHNLELAMAEVEARREEARQAQESEVEVVPIREHNFAKGADAEDALVTVVEFSSFPCPFCARGSATLEQLVERYPDEVRVVFKHFPLANQPQAMPASLAAQAAGEQGQFWEMYDLIYEHQADLHEGIYREVAGQLGLDEERFVADMESEALFNKVERDREDGLSAGVQGTPGFAINGLRENGAQALQVFEAHVEQQVAVAREIQEERGLEGDALYEAMIEHNQGESDQ